jgi:hypothetical protein
VAQRRCATQRTGALGGRGERRDQQHDAEVGVAAHRSQRRRDGALDALADGRAMLEQRRGRRRRAGDELRGVHAMPG